MPDTILVHGRTGLNRSISRGTDAQPVDLTPYTYVLEIPALGLRRLLARHPVYLQRKLLQLSRDEVALLPATATPFVILDETNPAFPVLASQGLILRVGNAGAADD